MGAKRFALAVAWCVQGFGRVNGQSGLPLYPYRCETNLLKFVMRVIVTRPEADAASFAEALARRGHEAISSPVLRIEPVALDDIGSRSIQALIATSRNALMAIAGEPDLDAFVELPIFTVGTATSAVARGLGFHGVMEGPGTAEGLAEFIVANADPSGGQLLHLTGEISAFDLPAALAPAGFKLTSLVTYKAVAMDALAKPARLAIENGEADAVALMSPRSAVIYLRLAEAAGLSDRLAGIEHLCLSKAIAERLSARPDLRVHVAEKPKIEEMLALVNRIAAQLGK